MVLCPALWKVPWRTSDHGLSDWSSPNQSELDRICQILSQLVAVVTLLTLPFKKASIPISSASRVWADCMSHGGTDVGSMVVVMLCLVSGDDWHMMHFLFGCIQYDEWFIVYCLFGRSVMNVVGRLRHDPWLDHDGCRLEEIWISGIVKFQNSENPEFRNWWGSMVNHHWWWPMTIDHEPCGLPEFRKSGISGWGEAIIMIIRQRSLIIGEESWWLSQIENDWWWINDDEMMVLLIMSGP